MLRARRSLVALATLALASLALSACQFQPLYAPASGTASDAGLSSVAVAEVDTREAQQVRNHLVFLLSGGEQPAGATHEVRLRVNSNVKLLATKARLATSTSQIGNTAGNILISASYDIYDFARKEIMASGNRSAAASFDRTSQSFASERAERDAADRAARALAEQLRLAIAAELSRP